MYQNHRNKNNKTIYQNYRNTIIMKQCIKIIEIKNNIESMYQKNINKK